MKMLSLIFLSLLHSFFSLAQQPSSDPTDSVLKKINWYGQKNPSDVLFAHLDKTIYTNNESVWFTAYLLNSKAPDLSTVLSVMLINSNDHAIILQEKFIMSHGIAFGNMLLPDTLAPGNYSFLMYTNVTLKGKPLAMFAQPITVKNVNTASFNAFLQLTDTAGAFPGSIQKVLLVTDAPGRKSIAGAQVSYQLDNKIYSVHGVKQKTDNAGQYVIQVPAQDIRIGNNVLQVKVTYGKEVKYLKMLLPVRQEAPVIRFYPEGGSLADGIPCTVGWEATNVTGAPLKIKATLFENSKPVEDVATDNNGIGRFVIIPSPGNNYRVEIKTIGSSYNLPTALKNRPVIFIGRAVCDDTLRAVVKTTRPGKFYIIVHNYRESFYSFPVNIAEPGKILKISLTDIPKGIATITVLDSLQRPCAERLFFAHYDRQAVVDVSTDKNEYSTRGKITLKLKLQNINGLPSNGLVSVACVQTNRLDLSKINNIESYFYLQHELNNCPPFYFHNGQTKTARAYLENLLLIKGWRKYNWPDMIRSTTSDSEGDYHQLKFSGTVTSFEKKLKKPVTLVVMRAEGINTVFTNNAGHFLLEDSCIYVQPDKKFSMFVSNKLKDGYGFNLVDPYLKLNSQWSLSVDKENVIQANPIGQDVNNNDLKGFEHAIQLKEVKINAAGNNYPGPLGRNACGDYVCRYNVLNCWNHPLEADNTQPVTGRLYMINGGERPYHGCDTYDLKTTTISFKGINYPMEFYGADYEKINPSQPDYVSTIYWKHLCKIYSDRKVELSFYASDITGPFKIIVQGVTDAGVIYGEGSLLVKKAAK